MEWKNPVKKPVKEPTKLDLYVEWIRNVELMLLDQLESTEVDLEVIRSKQKSLLAKIELSQQMQEWLKADNGRQV